MTGGWGVAHDRCGCLRAVADSEADATGVAQRMGARWAVVALPEFTDVMAATAEMFAGGCPVCDQEVAS